VGGSYQDSFSETQNTPHASNKNGTASFDQPQPSDSLPILVRSGLRLLQRRSLRVFDDAGDLHDFVCCSHVLSLLSFCLGVPGVAPIIVLLRVSAGWRFCFWIENDFFFVMAPTLGFISLGFGDWG
jgi:hypothetical protein